MFIFIQRVLGVSVYTGCCSIATSKIICLSSYREFQECQCIQSVAVLPRARLYVYLHTESSRSVSVYRVLQYCHEQDYMFIFIQRVPGVSVYRECCSIATSKTIFLSSYREF